MPPEITRDGAYKVYKGHRYTVYDDGNSADTPQLRDEINALRARVLALRPYAKHAHVHCGKFPDGTTTCTCGLADLLAQLDKEGLK